MRVLAPDLKEEARLKALKTYSILDTMPEGEFDMITSIASQICGTPISTVSMVADTRVWFKSHHGLDCTEAPREYAFCSYAIQNPKDVYIVEDASKDPEFADNPLVAGAPHMIFYAGVPLVTEEGFALGTLTVIDQKPHRLNAGQIAALQALAYQVVKLLELRQNRNDLAKEVDCLSQKNSDLEQFACVAAHDLRSPLNSITGLISLLHASPEIEISEESSHYLDMIGDLSTKLKGMIDGLLEYSRSTKLPCEDMVPVDVKPFMEEIKILHEANARVTLKLHAEVDTVMANRVALSQILINLVSNAVKYNDKPQAVIEIGVMEHVEQYFWYVKDNGPGIPKEYHDRIFRLFEIATKKDQFGNTGTGIGLATGKKLVERLGGDIWVESKRGVGTLFNFTVSK